MSAFRAGFIAQYLGVLCALPGTVAAQETEQARIDAALTLTRDHATRYEMVSARENRLLKLHPHPILRWSNPEQGQIYGNVFLWCESGRPAVVGSLYKWYSPFTHMSHEFQSLSPGSVKATYEGREVWHASDAGVSFAAVPQAPAVADAASSRLLQMRQLARKFTAREVTREGEKIPLRLLTQPVYRHEELNPESGVIDGALFVFVQGTDPEVWLLLEALKAQGQGTPQWTYAFSRMNSIELAADFDGREVWHREALPWADVASHKEPYTSFRFNEP